MRFLKKEVLLWMKSTSDNVSTLLDLEDSVICKNKSLFIVDYTALLGCPAPMITSGYHDCPRGISDNTSCNFYCIIGYELVGFSSSFCVKKHNVYRWDPTIPSCTREFFIVVAPF